MINIIDDIPANELTGRLLASANFVDNFDIQNKNILDIGCGYGWCEINFFKRGAQKITGIEITEKDLKTIKKHVEHIQLELKVAEATNLPFKNETFDTIVSWEVIEHIPKNTEALMFLEIYRVLKTDGCLYLSTPNKTFFSNLLDPAWYFGHRHYTKERLINLAKKNKFTLIKEDTKGSWWVCLSLLNMYISKWIFRRNGFLRDFFKKKEQFEYNTHGFVNLFLKFKK